jgi:hypothetical protein
LERLLRAEQEVFRLVYRPSIESVDQNKKVTETVFDSVYWHISRHYKLHTYSTGMYKQATATT